jgi:hypothetical protein
LSANKLKNPLPNNIKIQSLQRCISPDGYDDILNPDKELPKDVTVEDKTTMEQVRLIQQLDDEDKHEIFRMIDIMLTKKKFKDFFQKKVATL